MLLFHTILTLLSANLALGAPSHAQEAELQGIIDDLVNTTINELLASLEDPLALNSSFTKYNNAILTGWVNTTDFTLTGLQEIVATAISVHLLPPTSLNLTVNVQNLNLFLNYDTNLILGQLLPFFGTGNISANIDSFNVNLYTLAEISTNPLGFKGLKNATISFSVGKNTFLKIEGIWRSDSISKTINDFLEVFLSRFIDFLDSNQERISNVLSPILQAILDQFFN
ncbi:uncharacterized protein LOC126750692 [Anthonomus grandis grandis]|uniref:uncharacterized protein LOC126750692 n=1 Tax=Anthonomus grandis grandis TaxID=2921223 RepID=UPI0021654CDD|nr:uncharacterized protein LOC126750692 [Anthonomus grandis grandis]